MSNDFNQSEDATISVNGVSHPLLCGFCQKPIAFIGEADIQSGDAGCLACGNIANVQEVGQMAVEYAKDEGQLILNRLAKETAAKAGSFVSFTGQTEHDKRHRFVIDLKLDTRKNRVF